MFLGNLGTYRYMCFTAVGPVVNLACGLARQATPGTPRLSQATQEQVGDRFTYSPESPLVVEVAAAGTRRVWDVTNRASPTSRPSER